MKLKFLLFQLFLMVGVFAYAQNDTIKTLIISEAHLGNPRRNYIEITNMGIETLDLSNFELGDTQHNTYVARRAFRLPVGTMLEPGESYFIGIYHDFVPDRAKYLGMENYTEDPMTEFEQAQDYKVHVSDYDFANDPNGIGGNVSAWIPYDSIESNGPPITGTYFGRYCVYIEQHFPSGDSAIIDQVMGVFDTDLSGNGVLSNKNMANPVDGYDVAGYPNAGTFANLIRKYSVKRGNLEFIRGNSEDDSEWLTVTNISDNPNRMQHWTYGNHGDYNLDANTLVPKPGSGVEVDFQNKLITVPWGTLRPDGIMQEMEYKPGVAWEYIISSVPKDSMTMACRTGDSLLVIVVGQDADRAKFRIEVEEPTASENRLIPMMNEGDDYTSRFTLGFSYINEISPVFGFGPLSWPWVFEYESADVDTITGFGSSLVSRGIPEGTRVDTLLERLDKPANATMMFVPVDGNTARPDIVEGDKIKVTAEDGSVREYYIKTYAAVGNNNAHLSSITWPDISDPELFKFLYGWQGDTIAGFTSNSFLYQMTLPPEVKSIPATIAKPSDVNAKVEVQRATFLQGTQEERTTTYTVTATDDTTILTYSVEWQPESDPQYLQPYFAEPFVSEWISREQWNNYYLEICNPGNQRLDMSNYMIVAYANGTTPAQAIEFNPVNWLQRYKKYVPGYKWVDEATWASTPGILVPDPAVSSWVEPGDVFCLGRPVGNNVLGSYGGTPWSYNDWPGAMGGVYGQSDVTFYNNDFGNPWGEDVATGYAAVAEFNFAREVQYIFKILNDSIKKGLKAATDPNDFELIEAVGTTDNSQALFGYAAVMQGQGWQRFNRKPEINTPNPVLEASFGSGDPAASADGYDETSEWERWGRWNNGVSGYPRSWIYGSMMDYGKHYFIPSTSYMSTVSARIYKVSPGYSMNETIRGLVAGVNVSEFFEGITKKDAGQTLTVVSAADGNELGMDDLIVNGDALVVVSADESNTTKYVLEVTENGLRSDALLTSSMYDIEISVEPTKSDGAAGVGSITGFEYGTQLVTILANVTVPDGATMSIINANGDYVPLKQLNFDTVYVNVTVNSDTYFEVVAEDGITTITYQLMPQASASSAFITSDYFGVNQSQKLVTYVPGGISVSSLLSKLVPSAGATLKIVDKSGLDRTMGTVARDDEIVVTSANGSITSSYFIQFITSADPDGKGLGYWLAYLTSNFYAIDQVINKITINNNATSAPISISEFISRVVPHTDGATVEVIDDNGDGKLNDVEDMVKVTARDSRFSVMYSVAYTTSAPTVRNTINLYPNPTTGLVNITGLEVGGRVQVFSTMGAVVRDFKVRSNVEELSLDDQPAGMYLIRISDANAAQVGRYKLMKR